MPSAYGTASADPIKIFRMSLSGGAGFLRGRAQRCDFRLTRGEAGGPLRR